MKQTIGYVSVVVKDYDEAIKFYVDTLGFTLIEDTFIEAQNKRWVLVAPPDSTETKLLLARAVGEEQSSRIGNQTRAIASNSGKESRGREAKPGLVG